MVMMLFTMAYTVCHETVLIPSLAPLFFRKFILADTRIACAFAIHIDLPRFTDKGDDIFSAIEFKAIQLVKSCGAKTL